jgi:hypothetical protein
MLISSSGIARSAVETAVVSLQLDDEESLVGDAGAKTDCSSDGESTHKDARFSKTIVDGEPSRPTSRMLTISSSLSSNKEVEFGDGVNSEEDRRFLLRC